MRYLSVCSGIEAATCAWHGLGWTPAAFAEVEKFPSAVLAHHYPNVPNLGDMTRFQEWPEGFADDYTAIPWRGKAASECPDGPRYKALGNSMAVPVMRWIGERIAAVDGQQSVERAA